MHDTGKAKGLNTPYNSPEKGTTITTGAPQNKNQSVTEGLASSLQSCKIISVGML